jgi:hypothetical protein
MEFSRRRFRVSAGVPILVALGCLILPRHLQAIPAFARKFNVKCYNCHTIPPALNKTGYIFKRLGYRLPPDEMDSITEAPRVLELENPEAKFDIGNTIAVVAQGSFTADKNAANAVPSTSSFNLDEAAFFLGGTVPQTGFSYFAQYEFFQDGTSNLEQANFIYTGGRASSSYFIKAGEMHMQEGEGTRAAMFYNLFPDPALTLTNVDPLNFTLDQHPVGVDVGYTFATPYFKQILAVSAKVTNGLNPDGSEILFNSTKTSKDLWFDVDYWFGPDGGITFMAYRGTKDQIQNSGTPDQFTYRPVLNRYGIFGNYLFFDKLDILGGYIRSRDDWQGLVTSPVVNYTSNGYRGEVDYYIQTGFALMARYDRLNQTIAGQPTVHTEAWGVGSERALVPRGNVVLRATYNHERDTDPVQGTSMIDKLFRIDLRLMW